MTEYLQKRGNRYSFRRKIPLEIRSQFGGREEIVKALGTSDPHEAAVLCRQYAVSYDLMFAAARQSIASADSVRASIQSAHRAVMTQQRDSIKRGQLENDEAWLAHEYRTEDQEIAAHDRFEELIRQERYRLFVEREAARRDALERSVSTENPASQPPPGRSRPPSVPVRSVAASSDVHLAALVEMWTKERQPSPRTVRKAELVVERFYSLVGRIPVAAITRADCIAFKDRLLESGQTAVNTNNHLETLGTLLNFAVDNLLAAENRAQRIRVRAKAKSRASRISFDLPALQSIFASPIYTQGERPSGGEGEASYWLPLLALFTGARIEELCQLHPGDIFAERYFDATGTQRTAWVLRITNEGEGQGVKNAGSVRRIPIHAELLTRGFVDYVDGQRGQARVFPKLAANKYGEESGLWSKWFGKWLRQTCNVADRRMTFHSFRHGFKDLCRECGVSKEIADALQGHSDGDASDDYGGEYYPLRPLVEATAMIHVAGLVLPTAPQTLSP